MKKTLFLLVFTLLTSTVSADTSVLLTENTNEQNSVFSNFDHQESINQSEVENEVSNDDNLNLIENKNVKKEVVGKETVKSKENKEEKEKQILPSAKSAQQEPETPLENQELKNPKEQNSKSPIEENQEESIDNKPTEEIKESKEKEETENKKTEEQKIIEKPNLETTKQELLELKEEKTVEKQKEESLENKKTEEKKEELKQELKVEKENLPLANSPKNLPQTYTGFGKNLNITIHSKVGQNLNWNSPSSWEENRIPNENDVVYVSENSKVIIPLYTIIKSKIINKGEIFFEERQFSEITDEQIKILSSIYNSDGSNDFKSDTSIMIEGDIYNEGSTEGYVKLFGNIYNNGEWRVFSVLYKNKNNTKKLILNRGFLNSVFMGEYVEFDIGQKYNFKIYSGKIILNKDIVFEEPVNRVIFLNNKDDNIFNIKLKNNFYNTLDLTSMS